jgi:hypothetical protein
VVLHFHLKLFSNFKLFLQDNKISFSTNSLLNKVIDELKSMKEVELKEDQMNYHEGEYIDQVVKRGEDGFQEHPRKNGLR